MLSEWAHEQEPVFIVGPERSGTSLLFQQVSNHPSFCDFSFATVETFCFVKPWMLLNPAGPENYEMRVYLGSKEQFKAFQNKISPLVERNKMLTSTGLSIPYFGKPDRKKIWFERRYKHVLRAFFFHSWNNLGKKRLVEKTPAHIRCVDEILATFPKAKILICTRDITEIISSHKKRLKKEVELGKKPSDPSIAWLAHSTEQYVKYLKSINNNIVNLIDSHSDCKIVPYGDLTNDSTNTLENVFSFISEDFRSSNDSKQVRTEQAWDPLLNKPPQRNITAIKEYLTTAEIAYVSNQKNAFKDFWR